MLLNAIAADEPRLPPAKRYAARLATVLTSGGDARIRPDADGRNQYYASVLPSDALAYGSSTISSISDHAFQTLLDRWHHGLDRPVAVGDYAEALAILRFKLVEAFGTPDTAVVFAASGTDLEYVGLAAAHDGKPITAILLGRDEVGSGCVHSAAGRFFAEETATGARVVAQTAIDPAFAGAELVDVAVRDAAGRPRASAAVTDELAAAAQAAIARGRRPIVHVVHGSKSGLTLPVLADVERLTSAFGDAVTIVVDACQLRVAPAAIRRYLALGCVVLMTGSKFAGGPPFSGFALVPDAARARPLPAGFRRVATRAEWPADWPGADNLPASGNFGLLLRLQAAMIEIERFAALPAPQVDHIANRFGHHVDRMIARLELRDVPGAGAAAPCLAAATLRTLDLSGRWPTCDFDHARALHRQIARQSRQWLGREIRLGQPVRTHCLADGRAAGTLRLSLSMPMMVEMAALDDAALDTRLDRDMGLVGAAISASSAAMDSSRPTQHA
jgi:hypothetical protein